MRLNKFLLIGIAALSIATAAPAYAAGIGQGLQDFAQATGDGTVGKLISSTIYGNTSNGPGTPSWSPGPHVCGTPGDCAGPTADGSSMGGIIAPLVNNGNADPQYKAQPHDFSAPHL